MNSDPTLEQYLVELDRALLAVSLSERAEILMGIKNQVLAAQAQNPSRSVSETLAMIGEPQAVANRFLLERGLKLGPTQPPRASPVKWLAIGFLGMVALVALTILAVIWKFTPLLKVDEKSGKVTMLGGAIDLSSTDITEKSTRMGAEQIFEGATSGTAYQGLSVHFVDGKMDFRASTDGRARWSCRTTHDGGSPANKILHSFFNLDLSSVRGATCKIEIPTGWNLIASGQNGVISLTAPQGPLTARLQSGMIFLSPDPKLAYRYSLKTEQGLIDPFVSAKDPHSIPIVAEIKNGSIKNSSSLTSVGQAPAMASQPK